MKIFDMLNEIQEKCECKIYFDRNVRGMVLLIENREGGEKASWVRRIPDSEVKKYLEHYNKYHENN